jgi:exonuclease III
MKILGVNCQGLGNDPTVRSLVDLHRQYCPDVLFLSETHLDDYLAECLRRRLKLDSKICNPSDGRSGGLLLLYRKEIKVELIHSYPMYIDVRIIENQDKIWRFTGIYGESRWDQKYKTWDKLRELRNNSPLPSIVLGDFNELLFSHEKEGAIRVLQIVCKLSKVV